MEPNQDRSLIPRESNELSAPLTAQSRILIEMVKDSVTLAKDTASPTADLDALVQEGRRIRHESGITPENIRAFNLFLRAAKAGHPEGQREVGYCFGWECGVEADSEQANYWFRQAAEQGDADSQCRLAEYYSNEDPSESVKWYRKAAEQGYWQGQFMLADCYSGGKGVPRDYSEAYAWYRLAADEPTEDPPITGAGWFQEQAAALAALMSPSQLLKARQLYQDYKRKHSTGI